MDFPGHEASGSVLPPEDNVLVRPSNDVPGVTPTSEASSMGPIRRSPSPIPEEVDDVLEWPPLGASSESWADNCDREEASPPEPIPPTPLLPLATVALVPNTVNRSVESTFPTSLVTATSIISSSTISTSSRVVPSNPAPPTPQEASTHLGPVSVTPSTEQANASVAPPLASPQEGPFNPRNDYNWVPTAPASRLKPKDLPVQPPRVRASSLLQLTRQALAAMATSSLVNPTVTTSPTVLATGPAAPMLSMGSVPPVSVPQTSTPQISAPQASVNSIWQLPPPVRNAAPARSEALTSLPTVPSTTSSNLRPSDVTVPTVPTAPVSSAAMVTGSGARPKVRGTPATSGVSPNYPMNTAPTVPQGATGPAEMMRSTTSTTDNVTITAELFQQLLDAAAAQRRDPSPH